MANNAGSRFSRRSLIRGAGGIAAAAAAGTLSANIATAAVDPGEWSKLRDQLRGRLVLPDDREYRAAKALVDPRFNGNTPLAVVEVAQPQDVQAAVAFARDRGLPIAARAGGHSFVGASASTGALVIDVRKLDHVSVEGDRVTVGAGVNSLTALTELAGSKLALPVGTCSSVGLAGLTVGGGLGVDSRRYGMTCDRLVAADLVLPNGDAVRADATSAPELFWALRGAGGSVGILTSLTYHPIPASAKDIVRLSFAGDQAARVLNGWAQWAPFADRGIYARVDIRASADGPRCAVLLVCPPGTGPDAADDLADAAGTTPSAEEHRTFEHLDAVHDINLDKPHPNETRIAGSDVCAQLTPAVADLIVDLIAARSRSGQPGFIMVEPGGGAISDLAPDATAFPWRAHAALLEWAVPAPSSPDEGYRWITAANRALAPHSAGGYLNHVEPTDTIERCFAHNFPRLQLTRQITDPDRRLRWGING
ncbi:FAD binding domain-containing protein [Nocardia tenerifensis]|uniref:FAD binding domain-containing protein n=1 Tax=Nocardia tenerifensis TaxID=228006 RepID=A0A318KA87_9NOCA|nr:FAD-binding oxidoreductase [Nocardia tenerifensis]PXX66715.1 FAD binding domain-containing protein [Nocardia tenerifensis]